MAMNDNLQQSFLDFGNAHLRSFAQIASSFNQDIVKIIGNISDWPTKSLCIFGEYHSGIDVFFNEWIKANNALTNKDLLAFGDIVSQVYIAYDACDMDEDILLNALMLAEANKASLLIKAYSCPKEWEVYSADLRSRINNLTKIEIKPPSLSILSKIIEKYLSQKGYKIALKEAKIIINASNKSFDTIFKFISLIEELFTAPNIIGLDKTNLLMSEYKKRYYCKDFFDE